MSKSVRVFDKYLKKSTFTSFCYDTNIFDIDISYINRKWNFKKIKKFDKNSKNVTKNGQNP
jgi:hypothetical protein